MCDKCERAMRSTAPDWRGRYSRTQLRAACAELGVERPVRIVCEELGDPGFRGRDYGWKFGNEIDDEDGNHVITVCDRLPLDVANHTILHELAHSAQTEREGFREHQRRYLLMNRVHGYADNPYEDEADEVADRLADRYSIARG